MRILPLPNEIYNPWVTIRDDREEERKARVEYEIRHFIRCLEKDRNLNYIDRKVPDVTHRNDPRPDRLFEELKTGSMVAIEYADLRQSQKETQRIAYEVERCQFPRWYDHPTPQELAFRLVELINEKKHKNQFVNYPNAERLYLFRNMWSITISISHFHECCRYLELPKDPGCDHCYILIHKGVILEAF
jgi:hypothetical protein